MIKKAVLQKASGLNALMVNQKQIYNMNQQLLF